MDLGQLETPRKGVQTEKNVAIFLGVNIIFFFKFNFFRFHIVHHHLLSIFCVQSRFLVVIVFEMQHFEVLKFGPKAKYF